jgi:hypothetical protein
VTKDADVQWAAPYFGDTSSWARFTAVPSSGGPARRVQIDEIYSTSRDSLAQYGLNAYSGGFDTASAHAVHLARGVTGLEIRSFGGEPAVAWTRRVGGSTNGGFEEVFVTARWPGSTATGTVESLARSLVGRS